MLIDVAREVFVDLSLSYVGYFLCLYAKKGWFLFPLKNWAGHFFSW